MITINEPERNFRDFDNFIRHLTCLETEQRRVQAMPKGETSIRSASQQASVHIWHPEYNVDIYFTKAYMSIFSFPYNLLKNMLIHSEDITGYDIDKEQIKIARQNAALAGLTDMISFECAPVSELNSDKEYGFIITNPPYGERLEEKEALPALYKEIGAAFDRLPTWSEYVISSYEDAARYIGKKPDKNRKIYNGMIKTYYYSFLGPRPLKKQ